MKKYIWGLLNWIQALPFFPNKYRSYLLRLFGVSIGSGSFVGEGCFVGGSSLVVGDGVLINVGCFLDGSASITIGDMVRFGPFVRILTGSHPYENSVIRRSPQAPTIGKPVKIGRGCWIGIGTVIMPGVTIAEGCIIAAGSVVIGDTEPNGLYAGNPAVRKKDLSTENDTKF